MIPPKYDLSRADAFESKHASPVIVFVVIPAIQLHPDEGLLRIVLFRFCEGVIIGADGA